MKFQRVLLVRTLYNLENTSLYEPPLPVGLGYIAKVLDEIGVHYDVIDLSFGYNFKEIKRRILDFRPDLVGVSFLTYKYKKAYELIKQIKQINMDFKIVVGGPHLSTLREKVLRECPDVDYGVILEGEHTIVELCKGKEVKQIDGLIYREGNNVFYNADRAFIENLDSLSFPTYDKFELNKYLFTDEVPICIESSRGCPSHCIYCPVIAAIGKKFRARSASSVVDEIEYWYKKGRYYFNFIDDNFTLNKDRVYAICDEIEKRNLRNLKLICAHGIRADRVDKKLLSRMREVGFNSIAFGVEAGNNKVLHNLKKGEDIAKIDQAIKDACELGYSIELFFLIGSPSETWADIEDSIALAKKYPVTDAKFYNIIPYPSTELFSWIEQNNYFTYQPEDYLNNNTVWDNVPLFITPELSLKEKIRALKYTKSVRRGIRRRNYQRRLAKYGIVGKVISALVITDFLQNLLLSNRVVRKDLRRIKRWLIPESSNIS